MAKNILLVDDEVDFTELTGTLLRFHDFEVDSYNDPIDVEKVMEGKHYDLIVTDLMMPKIDGFALVQNIRGKVNYKKTPIIVLSAKTLNDVERKILLQNDVHFLTKPFEPQALVDEIRQLVA